MEVAHYIIAIDLGTTNCTMAYARLPKQGEAAAEPLPEIELLSLPQLVDSGLLGYEKLLPSFIHFPLEAELKKEAAKLPWDAARRHCVGVWAKERGATLPTCTIASAKSWLCHATIDRREPLLPVGAEADQQKMSPLEACAALLSHLREAWDWVWEGKAPFVEQELLITVPASFDPSARQLVQEAAELAGYGAQLVLLEEPLAAFYGWLYLHPEEWRDQLPIGSTALIIDIGGGTCDFTTIAVEERGGTLQLERKAVGSHLLLGGDNIDLLIAYMGRDRLEAQGQALDEGQWQSLLHASRRCKEELLGENPPEKCALTIAGRGRKLVGATLKVDLSREELVQAILDSFFPLVAASEQSPREKRAGLQQLGLPYAQDGRVTAQLAKFLSMRGEAASGSTEQFVLPTALLFNGGTMRSGKLRERLVEQVARWCQELGHEAPKVLEGADYDYAVSRGAVYYGLARKGQGVRIKAGASRSYFIGIEEAQPAIPGRAARMEAICVVPYGMEEGSEQLLGGQSFAMVVGEPVTFRFFSHATPQLSDGTRPVMGTRLRQWEEELTELHPVETAMEREPLEGKLVKVGLRSHLTELGFLELFCEAANGRRWRLEFDVRRDGLAPEKEQSTS